MNRTMLVALVLALLPFLGEAGDNTFGDNKADGNFGNEFDRAIQRNNADLFKQGRHIFRYDTFGNEVF